jgi:hypothetical protein
MTGPWMKLSLVGLRYIRPTDDLAIDDPLAGWCMEANAQSGVAFRRLPPRGLAPKAEERSLWPMLIAGGLMILGVWRLWDLAAWLFVVVLRGG